MTNTLYGSWRFRTSCMRAKVSHVSRYRYIRFRSNHFLQHSFLAHFIPSKQGFKLYYQPKQRAIVREIPQNDHVFASSQIPSKNGSHFMITVKKQNIFVKKLLKPKLSQRFFNPKVCFQKTNETKHQLDSIVPPKVSRVDRF